MTKSILTMLFMILLGATLIAQTDEKQEKKATGKQLICAVTGEEANSNLSYEYEGSTYYFCCKGCMKKFKADPSKYIKSGDSDEHAGHNHGAGHDGDGQELSFVNTKCPVSGEELSADSPSYEYEGKLYGFCCEGCMKKFAKDPEKYLKGDATTEHAGCDEMEHASHEKDGKSMTGKVVNTKCPVGGGEITADSPTFEYNGKVYGFCCGGCKAKFMKDPEKYLKES